METQLNKAKGGKNVKSGESQGTPGDNSTTNDPTFATFQAGLTVNASSLPADGISAPPRQPSIPEEQSNDPLMMPMTNSLGPDILPDSELMGNLDLGGLDANFSWEMIGLGLEEPMPLQEASDELYGTVQPCLIVSNFI